MYPSSYVLSRNYKVDSDSFRCLLCKDYHQEKAAVCTKCYEGAMREIKDFKDLKEKSDFLSLLFPGSVNSTIHSFTDITLEASDDNTLENSDAVNTLEAANTLEASDAVNKSVRAHRVILASRSETFRAMLENEMEESQTGIIKIRDVSFGALTSFVSFLYTAEVKLDEQKAHELLILADIYQVEHLKSHCELFFIGRMSWKTSLLDYAFAEQNNAKRMQAAAINVIKDNTDKKIHENEGYEELSRNNKQALIEIYHAFTDKIVDLYNSKKQ